MDNFKQVIEDNKITSFMGLENTEDMVEAMEIIVQVSKSGKVNMFDYMGVRDQIYNKEVDWVADQFTKNYKTQYCSFICGNFEEVANFKEF